MAGQQHRDQGRSHHHGPDPPLPSAQQGDHDSVLMETVARLERRLAVVERFLFLGESPPPVAVTVTIAATAAAMPIPPKAAPPPPLSTTASSVRLREPRGPIHLGSARIPMTPSVIPNTPTPAGHIGARSDAAHWSHGTLLPPQPTTEMRHIDRDAAHWSDGTLLPRQPNTEMRHIDGDAAHWPDGT